MIGSYHILQNVMFSFAFLYRQLTWRNPHIQVELQRRQFIPTNFKFVFRMTISTSGRLPTHRKHAPAKSRASFPSYVPSTAGECRRLTRHTMAATSIALSMPLWCLPIAASQTNPHLITHPYSKAFLFLGSGSIDEIFQNFLLSNIIQERLGPVIQPIINTRLQTVIK